MRYLIMLLLLANTLGCVSLNDVYSEDSSRREIRTFCDAVHKDYGIAKSKISIGDCIVKASLVERENKYETILWYLTGSQIAIYMGVLIGVISTQ